MLNWWRMIIVDFCEGWIWVWWCVWNFWSRRGRRVCVARSFSTLRVLTRVLDGCSIWCLLSWIWLYFLCYFWRCFLNWLFLCNMGWLFLLNRIFRLSFSSTFGLALRSKIGCCFWLVWCWWWCMVWFVLFLKFWNVVFFWCICLINDCWWRRRAFVFLSWCLRSRFVYLIYEILYWKCLCWWICFWVIVWNWEWCWMSVCWFCMFWWLVKCWDWFSFCYRFRVIRVGELCSRRNCFCLFLFCLMVVILLFYLLCFCYCLGWVLRIVLINVV